MYTSGKKKKNKLFCDNKVQRKRGKPANRILKSEIQPLMESGIHGCGIRNPPAWNPESTARNPESGIQDSLGLPYMGQNRRHLHDMDAFC